MFLDKNQLHKKPRPPSMFQKLKARNAQIEILGLCPKAIYGSTPAAPERQKSYDSRYASLVKVAEYLNACSPSENDVFEALKGLGDRILEQDAVVVLNNMANPENALLALKYFKQNLKPRREVIPYNVNLKVCRKGKDSERAEKLFDELLDIGVQPDNFSFSTARMSSLPDKAVEWFEKMPSLGVIRMMSPIRL